MGEWVGVDRMVRKFTTYLVLDAAQVLQSAGAPGLDALFHLGQPLRQGGLQGFGCWGGVVGVGKWMNAWGRRGSNDTL